MNKEIVEKVVKKGHKQYEIKFKSGREIVVLEDVLLKFNLFKGSEITQSDLQKISLEQQITKSYQKALYYLNIKMRTRKEVCDYLKDDELPLKYIDEIIKRLENYGFIDDENYTKQYINLHIKKQDQGPKKIKNHLLKKGINEKIIDNSLSFIDEKEWESNALALAEKTKKKYHNQPIKEAKHKILNKLLLSGFDYEVSYIVVEKLQFEYDEDKEWIQLCKLADKLMNKYRKDSDYKKREKIRQNLYRKGYNYDLIQQYLDDNLD